MSWYFNADSNQYGGACAMWYDCYLKNLSQEHAPLLEVVSSLKTYQANGQPHNTNKNPPNKLVW